MRRYMTEEEYYILREMDKERELKEKEKNVQSYSKKQIQRKKNRSKRSSKSNV